MKKLIVHHLDGLTPYSTAHELQLETVEKIKAQKTDNTLYLLEHPPVITLGKNAAQSGVIASDDFLLSKGIEVHRIERGGQVTYHCPGQLVGYPIMDLHQLKFGVAKFVNLLEQVLIDTCAVFGIHAFRREGLTGIFVENGAKIGALGIRVTKGVSYHGFALNVAPDLSGYQLIVPCGMMDTPVTSMEKELNAAPTMEEVKNICANTFKQVFGMETNY